MLPSLVAHPEVKITAAADVRPEARTAFAADFQAAAYEAAEDLCRDPNVDAVYIATPHQFHREHVLLAAQYSKHAIVEKPMALTLEDCEAMNAAVDRAGIRLVVGHTHSFDPPVRKMAELVRGGELGQPLMINSSYYKNFIYRPFSDHDVAMSRGIVLNQGPHQVDVVRLLGGGLVRSVRATSGAADLTRGEPPDRPAEGHYACYLEFENGVAASLVFSGYAYLDTAELVWGIGEGGLIVDPQSFVDAHRFFEDIGAGPDRARNMERLLESWRYGGEHVGEWFGPSGSAGGERHQPFFGLTIVTCERGDVRQSPDGIYVYTEGGRKELPIQKGAHGREAEMRELYDAVVEGRLAFHDGRWGEATLEVCLAILESSARHEEIHMSHQVPVWD